MRRASITVEVGQALGSGQGRVEPGPPAAEPRDAEVADRLDEQGEGGVAGDVHDVGLERAELRRPHDAAGGDGVDALDEGGSVVAGAALGGQADGGGEERAADLEHLADRHADVGEPQAHGADHRAAVGLAHDEPPAGTTPHAGRPGVLDEAHGLPQHRAAHAEALEQVGLGAQHRPDRPALGHDLVLDATGHDAGQLGRRDGGPDARVDERHGRQSTGPGGSASQRL